MGILKIIIIYNHSSTVEPPNFRHKWNQVNSPDYKGHPDISGVASGHFKRLHLVELGIDMFHSIHYIYIYIPIRRNIKVNHRDIYKI